MVDIYEHSSDLYDALNKEPDKNQIKKIKGLRSFYGFEEKLTPLQALEITAQAFSKVFIKDEPKRLEQYNKLMNSKEFKIIKTELKNAEKYKKALEIINDKRVDMTSLKESLALDKEVWYYNNDRRFGKKLAKKEYDLLKEVLGNE